MLMLAKVAVAERTAVINRIDEDQDPDFLWCACVTRLGEVGLWSKSSRRKRCAVGVVIAGCCLRRRSVLSHRRGPVLGDSGKASTPESGRGSTISSIVRTVASLLCITLIGLSSSSTNLNSSAPSSVSASQSVSATSSSLTSSSSLADKISDLLLELSTDAKLARLENVLPETLRLSELVGC